MGARPGHALVSIALLRDQGPLAEAIYEGLAELARETGTRVVGGDTVRTPGPLVINVALVGEADPARLLRRSAARPGDVVAVTGTVGASAAGLELLLAGGRAAAERPGAARLVAAHHRPRPRLDAGAALAAADVRCAIDVSDGVASEVWHLARSSGVEIELEVNRLPLADDAVAILGAARATHLALTGGEDYELLFTVPEARFEAVAATLPADARATAIGRVTAARDDGVVRFLSAGSPIELEEAGYVAF